MKGFEIRVRNGVVRQGDVVNLDGTRRTNLLDVTVHVGPITAQVAVVEPSGEVVERTAAQGTNDRRAATTLRGRLLNCTIRVEDFEP